MSASTPTVIAGRYELQRRLAQGGMGEVDRQPDLTLDRKVAVKWLKPTLATDEIVAERFRREAIAAASLNHQHIVAVHDVFEQDGRQAVVMQLVDGKSLRQLLDTQKRLSPELTCHIGTAVAAALDHAHAAGFVHRDVKPGNIMITPDGRVLLTDFGIAKGLHGDGSDDLTSDNIMMGTAKYLSPEQVRGKKLDGRADLYSLGLVLYECLAGRVPFLGETDADTALARLQRDPTDLASLRATLPTRLVTTIHELLARNPDRRPATGAELVAELKQAQAEGPPEIDPTDAERSPVAPFSAGKLVRAPSDLRGRADDRHRGARTPTPPRGRSNDRSGGTRRRSDRSGPHHRPGSGEPAQPIPGQPLEHITGRVPVQPAPATTTAPPRDDTPPLGTPQRGAPAKGMGHRYGPSMTIVGGLIAIAVVLAIVLLLALQIGGGDSTAPTTVLPAGGADATADGIDAADEPAAADDIDEPVGDTDGLTTESAEPAEANVPAAIAAITTFDPDGDGSENDELLASARADDDPTTNWVTSCYSGEWMGAKRGVGLVVSFDQPTTSGLSVEVGHAPYTLEFLASDAETIPTSFAQWGARLGEYRVGAAGAAPSTETLPAPATPVRHVLVLVNQVAPADGCSDDNPYRGALGEITLLP